uniref:Uncharacterized protein n=1 Tax=Physcomitrium patens TaxID=3218 RepID=A0A2K1L1Q1_PHYPA|nr:hypothetical protein PHYPA_002749 [Physcomitrium patens]
MRTPNTDVTPPQIRCHKSATPSAHHLKETLAPPSPNKTEPEKPEIGTQRNRQAPPAPDPTSTPFRTKSAPAKSAKQNKSNYIKLINNESTQKKDARSPVPLPLPPPPNPTPHSRVRRPHPAISHPHPLGQKKNNSPLATPLSRPCNATHQPTTVAKKLLPEAFHHRSVNARNYQHPFRHEAVLRAGLGRAGSGSGAASRGREPGRGGDSSREYIRIRTMFDFRPLSVHFPSLLLDDVSTPVDPRFVAFQSAQY